MTTEYGQITYLMGTAAADKAVALDLIAMGACLAVGAVALRLVQLWREDGGGEEVRQDDRRTAEPHDPLCGVRRDDTGVRRAEAD